EVHIQPRQGALKTHTTTKHMPNKSQTKVNRNIHKANRKACVRVVTDIRSSLEGLSQPLVLLLQSRVLRLLCAELVFHLLSVLLNLDELLLRLVQPLHVFAGLVVGGGERIASLTQILA